MAVTPNRGRGLGRHTLLPSPSRSYGDVLWILRLLRQDDMGGVVRGGVLRALVAEAHRIDAGEEVLAPAQKHGGDHEVDLVDQPGGEVLAYGGNSSAESDVLALSRLLRALSAAWMPSVTKWKVVPPSIVMGARAWCVSTKTGTW